MSTEVDIATRVWRNIGEDRMMVIAAGGDVLRVRRIERAARHPREVRAAPESVVDRHFFRQAVDEDLSGELAKLS
jgi:hypothetical protein